MIKKIMSEMTLREKIGQTGMPNPRFVGEGIKEYGSLGAYFSKYPFTGFYLNKEDMIDKDGNVYTEPSDSAKAIKEASEMIKIPLLVSCDCERGAKPMYQEFHQIASNMALGAARSKELARKRAYYWARELKSMGANWPFGPVVDPLTNFFDSHGVRSISDQPEIICDLIPSIIQGIYDAGLGTCPKHFPSNPGKDYRDSHIANTTIESSLEEWRERCKPIWKTVVESGADGIMTGHVTFPAVEPALSRGKPLPSGASKKVLDLLREELGYDGVIITDDCGMKSLSSVFDYEDIYINCFNAGSDIILFCRNDYIDVMEKAVQEGKVSEAQIDKSVERILKLKQKLGLFDGVEVAPKLTEEEQKDFEQVCYDIAKKGLTLITNYSNTIPFDAAKVKKATIINVSVDPRFLKDLEPMVDAFAERGIEATIIDGLKSKAHLKEIADANDIIIYACYLKAGFQGLQWFSRVEDFNTLFHSLSSGAEKSVVASFSSASVYYNYFENTPTYINAYSNCIGTMRAFVDGILGEFEFTGTSPVALKPEFK